MDSCRTRTNLFALITKVKTVCLADVLSYLHHRSFFRLLMPNPIDALDAFFSDPRLPAAPVVAAGLSGGRDSVALFAALAGWMRSHPEQGVRVLGLHVHHGLSPHATEWSDFALRLGERFNIPVEVLHVTVDAKGEGIEAAARRARYEALIEAMRKNGAQMLLTAHHRDDLLETFLLQWVRGAGVDGLAAMPTISTLERWGAPDLFLGRPFLSLSRDDLTRFVTESDLPWVEDESNADDRYDRNRMRNRVLPVLKEAFPHAEVPAARSVRWCGEAAEILAERADEDIAFARCGDGSLDFSDLTPARRKNALRRWLSITFSVTVSSILTDEWEAQIAQQKTVERLRVFGDRVVHLHRGRIFVRPAHCTALEETTLEPALGIVWRSPDKTLSLVLEETKENDPDAVSLADLVASGVTVGPRRGGDRLHRTADGPGRILKDLWAEEGVPAFDRPHLPVLRVGGEVLSVAQLGTDRRIAAKHRRKAPFVKFVWATRTPEREPNLPH